MISGAVELHEELICAAAAGQVPERAELVRLLAPRIRLMVAARLSPAPDRWELVDDTAQEVMLALTQGLERLERRTVDGLLAYLSGIVAHQAAKSLARPDRPRAGAPARLSLDATWGSFSAAGPMWQLLSVSGTSPRTAVERAEQVAQLVAELGTLKESHRQIITLAFFDQLSLQDIAQETGLTRPAASMLLLRAIRALRERLLAAPHGEVRHG